MMLRSRSLRAAAAAIGLSLAAPWTFAQVTVAETFNYPTGLLGTTATTGLGQTGNWQQSFDDASGALLQIYTTTWTTPSGYSGPENDLGIGRRPTAESGSTSPSGTFTLSNGIDFDADSTLYFSFLFRSVGPGTAKSVFSFGNSGGELMAFQTTQDAVVKAVVGGNNSNGAALSAGDYLVVGRITTLAGTGNKDALSLWIYGSSDTVPGSSSESGAAWVSRTTEVTGTADKVTFRELTDDSTRFGQVLIGNSWESVVSYSAVPEPSAVALMLGLASLGFVALRRRVRRGH